MPVKKLAVVFVIISVAIGGFATGLYLLQQQQDIREQAAVPGGEAKVSLSPATGNFNIGDTINTSVSFNTAGIAISGIAVRMSYPFSGASPELSVSGIRINSALLSSGNWTCPTQNASQQGGTIVVDIACANTSATGFTSTSNTLLADVDIKVNRAPISTVEIKFDPALSVVTRKSDNQDILLIPVSTGKYTIAGTGGGESTPTPTIALGTPTPTVRATATPRPSTTTSISPTPTIVGGIGGLEDTPTPETLPVAGVSYPTVMGAALGVMVMVGAMLLAF